MAHNSHPIPILAAILSLIIPGVGQFYAGRPGWGLLWLLLGLVGWVGSGGCFGWVFNLIAAIQAFVQAENARR
ncbi:MAG: hypothetical protein HN348_09970 [Proteobacteria bacterium]|jgi:TM2 domain-containing membrane protein YozV|nr:hypothetical protein [Pseudomonadota bacterium]